MPQVYKLVHFERCDDVILPDGRNQAWSYTIVGPCKMGAPDIINCTFYGTRGDAIASISAILVQMHRRYNMVSMAQKLPEQLMREIDANIADVV